MAKHRQVNPPMSFEREFQLLIDELPMEELEVARNMITTELARRRGLLKFRVPDHAQALLN